MRRRPTTSKPSAGGDPRPAQDLLETARHERSGAEIRRTLLERQIILFAVMGRHYGVPIEGVERTERPSAVTPIPRAPAWLRGVTSLRGDVVTVIELNQLLAREGVQRLEDVSSLLVLRDGGRRVAVQSTSLPDFVRITEDHSLNLPPTEVDVYTGGLELNGSLVGVLDLTKLMDLIERRLEHA